MAQSKQDYLCLLFQCYISTTKHSNMIVYDVWDGICNEAIVGDMPSNERLSCFFFCVSFRSVIIMLYFVNV